MFVKTSENQWINLKECECIEIPMNESRDWKIEFYPRKGVNPYSIGTFRSEREAHEVLDKIWEAYQEGKPYFEPDPRKRMNVRIGDKWYADDEPIQAYLEAVQRLGLEKIEQRGLIFKDKTVPTHEGYPIVTKDDLPNIKQAQSGDYYILRLERPSTMKEVLEDIASELGIIDFEVTLYQD